jgi:hypothetical protein
MSVTPWLPTVRRIKDGETVEQTTVNLPIDQLTQRDQHLYEKFEEMSGKSVLTTFGQPIHPNETLQVGELSLVYYKSDSQGSGVAKGTTGFASTFSSMFTPNNSNYTFGLVKTVYPFSRTVDLYTEGFCDLPVDIDHPIYGLIQKDTSNTVEEFEVGPYYLSAKTPGKITRDPSGIPVYVGYAVNKKQFLLHTNVDEFSQFFINYRYHVLDRVAGIPTLSGVTWNITQSDITKLGWVSASAAVSSGAVAPTGAVFYYNIPAPSIIATDTYIASTESEEASQLIKHLPPIPANFVQLYVNGTLARYKDIYDTAGDFSINEYGLWWHKNSSGSQPWSTVYPQTAPTGSPSNWSTLKSTTISNSRKNIFISFSKFNPALRTQLVSSLRPFNKLGTDYSNNFIKFYSADDLGLESPTGDLLVSIDPKTDYVGYKKDFTSADISTLTDDFSYPVVRSGAFSTNRAIAALKYVKEEGVFKAAITPVVSKLVGGGGIKVTEEADTGIWTVGYLTEGQTGQVDSIEPINARLEFMDLTSYIKLPPPTSTPFGLIGKLVLPKGALNDKDLRIVFHLFGDTTSLDTSVAFTFEYSSVTAINSAASSDYITVNALKYTAPENPAIFNLSDSQYVAYNSVRISNDNFVIPKEHIREDSIVNFKILRFSTDNDTGYTGNVGILGIYWETLT